jgi:hypothetical protein
MLEQGDLRRIGDRFELLPLQQTLLQLLLDA